MAYALVAVGVLVPLSDGPLEDGRIATYILAVIGLPMWLHALLRRQWGWRVYLGYGLLVIAALIPLVQDGHLAERYTAPILFLATALGFVAGYLRRRESWWPLVPAGIATVAGVTLLWRQDVAAYLGATVLVIAGLWVILRQVTRPVMGDGSATGRVA
jgi:hypothetical protein